MDFDVSDPPWSRLRPETGDLLRPHVESVADELLARIPAEVSSYARPLEGNFGQAIRTGVGVAMDRFLMLPGTREPALQPSEKELYLALGAGESKQGRTLDALLAAYRVGARVAYSSFTRLGLESGLTAEELLPLGEAVFAYIDELSATSAEGFARDQSTRAGERERLRAALLGVIIAGSDSYAISAAAAGAGWTVPKRIRVIILGGANALETGARLGPETLVGFHGDVVIAVAPSRDGARGRSRLSRQLSGATAFVGPERIPEEAPESLRLAFLLAGSEQHQGAVGAVWLDSNVTDLIIGREPALLDELDSQLLVGLTGLKATTRARLEETLLYWLAYRGERATIAEQLHVHPQTIGYRMAQLRSLLGSALDDPDQRFAIELVLRSRHSHAVGS